MNHKISPRGEKQLKCNYCDMKLSQKHSFSTHIQHHTGENPFKCNFGIITFYQNDDLIKHKTIHTGEKPFKCNLCDKALLCMLPTQHLKVSVYLSVCAKIIL